MSPSHTITQLISSVELEHINAHPCHFELLTPNTLGEENRTSWFIETRRARFGSLQTSDIRLSHPTVSRNHALLELDQYGYRLIDQESKNGVKINQVRIRDAYLNDGDLLHIGGVALRFRIHQEQIKSFPLWMSSSFGELYGGSTPMRELFALLDRSAKSDASVLLYGESGTGKELAARALHQRSSRSQRPFVIFDCSTVPPNLIESELFGHAQGAFTGASGTRQGAFASAAGGTLFLDEVGELPLDLQPKLLRVLERGELKRLGEDHYRKIDVRVVSATHRLLNEEVERGTFRLDLYYRLAIVKVSLPPLREHVEDIPTLVERFISELSPHHHREIGFRTMQKLLEHNWPGNVRELKNYVQRAIALSAPDEVRLETRFLLPGDPTTPAHASIENAIQRNISPTTFDPHHDDETTEEELTFWVNIDINQGFKESKQALIDRFEKSYWRTLLRAHQDNISAAARVAGIHRKSAEYLIKKLGLRSTRGDE